VYIAFVGAIVFNIVFVGAMNVRKLNVAGRLTELTCELESYNWNILGISETKWIGQGDFLTHKGHKLWYCGEETRHEKGIAFMVHENALKTVLSIHPCSSRIIWIK